MAPQMENHFDEGDQMKGKEPNIEQLLNLKFRTIGSLKEYENLAVEKKRKDATHRDIKY